VVGAAADVYLTLLTLDGARTVNPRRRRCHGADDSDQRAHCQENASIPGFGGF